jgi:hypothetical protein
LFETIVEYVFLNLVAFKELIGESNCFLQRVICSVFILTIGLLTSLISTLSYCTDDSFPLCDVDLLNSRKHILQLFQTILRGKHIQYQFLNLLIIFLARDLNQVLMIISLLVQVQLVNGNIWSMFSIT